MLNVTGYSLAEASSILHNHAIVCEIVETVPPNCRAELQKDCWYVLRQNFVKPTICQLVVAAKIRPAYC
ncbi:hypothetical protein Ga0466249_003104 [Sporomusaceae bacterium BoRhaA]|uniref:hypothetical protein n=1 Tax=Pelorhabdus rhamnosifermentans TaxID=2772457 RepID=UPI001C0611D2|nr:hypothetical protein [Pelorhabdus rhamnosifermentans]MBU2701977.1 hypothetical protein [Pelorhabdus rhamnosifermentans]